MDSQIRASEMGLPPAFLHKMQMHWNKISRAFTAMDRGNSGRLNRSDFEYMCHRIGAELKEEELDSIITKFDKNGDGSIDYNEFCAVIGDLIKPPAISSGVSLNFNPNFQEKRPEGRSKNFKGLNAVWNNVYYQAMDHANSSGSGRPLLQNILEGRYYLEKQALRPQSAASYFKHGTVLDDDLGQPLVKSLIEGEYYCPKQELKNRNVKMDYIAHNRKMTREYSRLVAYNRPPSSATPVDSTRPGSNKGPYVNLAASLYKPSRSRLAQQISTPRTAQDLQELWGRALDPKFVASTLSWLSRASQHEKAHFKAAITGPTQISAQHRIPTALLQRSGRLASHHTYGQMAGRDTYQPPSSSHSHQRPRSAQPVVTVSQRASQRAGGGGGGGGGEEEGSPQRIPAPAPVRPSSSYGNRPSSRDSTGTGGGGRGGVGGGGGRRPASAHFSGLREADRQALMLQQQRRRAGAEGIHATIQKGTFGASWAAPVG